MLRSALVVCGVCWLALASNHSQAQDDSSTYQPGGNTGAYYGPGGYGGYGGYYGGWNNLGGGSTVAGSYLTGLGNAIRAEGQYNLMSSAATINLEEAAKRDIDNRLRWTNTYFEMRRINEAARHPQKPPTPPETWAKLAREAAPTRLTSSQLDPLTGTIYWPPLLQDDAFKADRSQLDTLFAERAKAHGAVGIEGYGQIRSSVDDALEKLKARIRQVNTQQYLEARDFLTSLAYEASFTSAG